MKPLVLWLAGMLILLPAAAPAAEAPLVSLSADVDRTAIWVGDRIHYRLVVDHAPQVHFVADNLKESSLNLAPFEIVSLDYRTGDGAEGRRTLEIDLVLSTYQAEAGELKIPSFSLFYFVDSATVTANSDRPAETLTVPPLPIALRSTLTEEVSSLRDMQDPPATPLRRKIAGTLPVVFVVLALLLAAPVFLQGRQMHSEQQAARERHALRTRLSDELRALTARTVSSDGDAAAFFDSAHGLLRDYLAASVVLPTMGKTGRELTSLLQADGAALQGVNRESLQPVPEILRLCDQVRYAPEGSGLARRNHSSAVERIREMLART